MGTMMRHFKSVIHAQSGIQKAGGRQRKVSRRAFTLIEIMVALAIFMLLLVIILVPLNMGMNLLHLGKAKADVQSASQQVIDQMRGDLTRAIYVYPNASIYSVTGNENAPKYPYGDISQIDEVANPPGTTNTNPVPVEPYFKGDPCAGGFDPETDRVENLARIDMLMPAMDNGSILKPIVPGTYLVTYYARRRDVDKAYHPIDNPILLFRAQVPFRGDPTNPDLPIGADGAALATAAITTANTVNANVYNSRYANLAACGTGSSRSVAWLTEDENTGEPNLEPLTDEDGAATPATAFNLYGSHVSVVPRNMGLVTGVNYKGYAGTTMVTTFTPPKSTFVCADTNGDGIVDQVSIDLRLETLDSAGAEPKGQNIGMKQVVDLPNVRAITGIR